MSLSGSCSECSRWRIRFGRPGSNSRYAHTPCARKHDSADFITEMNIGSKALARPDPSHILSDPTRYDISKTFFSSEFCPIRPIVNNTQCSVYWCLPSLISLRQITEALSCTHNSNHAILITQLFACSNIHYCIGLHWLSDILKCTVCFFDRWTRPNPTDGWTPIISNSGSSISL